MMKKQGLYDPRFEHDACGVGFVVNINGDRTHQIVTDGITILKNLIHRGAVGGDLKTGDGAGMLTQIPYEFFSEQCSRLKIKLPEPEKYGIGMVFLPMDEKERKTAVSIIEKTIASEGGKLLGFRDVPAKPDCLGEIALESRPYMMQFFVTFNGLSADELENKKLFRFSEQLRGAGMSMSNNPVK